MSGDGDGWVHCAAGHRHWGRFGAAGLLISDGTRAILQHRAPWTHEGDTWGLPGGARDSHEDVTSTALREAREEADIVSASIEPVATWIDDHGGWSYTTVLARPLTELHPHAANAESTEIRWWDQDEVDSLPLHHGFAATWPHLRAAPSPLLIVVDARADDRFAGWLRPPGPRIDDLDEFLRAGIPVNALPGRLDRGRVSSLLPRVSVVGAGRAPDLIDADSPWWRHARRVVTTESSPGDILDAVLRASAEDATGREYVVVTGDPEIRQRVAARGSATTLDASWLLGLGWPRPS